MIKVKQLTGITVDLYTGVTTTAYTAARGAEYRGRLLLSDLDADGQTILLTVQVSSDSGTSWYDVRFAQADGDGGGMLIPIGPLWLDAGDQIRVAIQSGNPDDDVATKPSYVLDWVDQDAAARETGIWHVDAVNGSDAHDASCLGTPDYPFATLSAALAAGGSAGWARLAPGTYAEAIAASGWRITGAGIDQTVVTQGAVDNTVYFTGAGGTLEDLTVSNTKAASGSNAVRAIWGDTIDPAPTTEGITLRNVRAVCTTCVAVGFENCRRIVLDDVEAVGAEFGVLAYTTDTPTPADRIAMRDVRAYTAGWTVCHTSAFSVEMYGLAVDCVGIATLDSDDYRATGFSGGGVLLSGGLFRGINAGDGGACDLGRIALTLHVAGADYDPAAIEGQIVDVAWDQPSVDSTGTAHLSPRKAVEGLFAHVYYELAREAVGDPWSVLGPDAAKTPLFTGPIPTATARAAGDVL